MKRGRGSEDVSAGEKVRDHEAEDRGLMGGRISDKHNSARTVSEKEFPHVDSLQGRMEKRGSDQEDGSKSRRVVRRV